MERADRIPGAARNWKAGLTLVALAGALSFTQGLLGQLRAPGAGDAESRARTAALYARLESIPEATPIAYDPLAVQPKAPVKAAAKPVRRLARAEPPPELAEIPLLQAPLIEAPSVMESGVEATTVVPVLGPEPELQAPAAAAPFKTSD